MRSKLIAAGNCRSPVNTGQAATVAISTVPAPCLRRDNRQVRLARIQTFKCRPQPLACLYDIKLGLADDVLVVAIGVPEGQAIFIDDQLV